MRYLSTRTPSKEKSALFSEKWHHYVADNVDSGALSYRVMRVESYESSSNAHPSPLALLIGF